MYEHVHVRGNCAIMSHANLSIVDEPGVGYSTIVARARETTFIVTSMSSLSSATKYTQKICAAMPNLLHRLSGYR